MALQNKALDTIRQSGNLPQLPQVMLQLIEACNNDETDTEELTRIICVDPALTFRLMEILGSAYINMPKEINSVESAVVYLGMDTIRNIAISSSAMHVFSFSEIIPEFNLNQFWYHSYKCAVISRKITDTMQLANPDEAFLAGLLHDIGRLLLVANFPTEYAGILNRTDSEPERLTLEKKTFDIDSPTISSWLYRQWNLNTLISDSALYVNEPVDKIDGALPLVKTIYVSNKFSDPAADTALETGESLTGISKNRLIQIIDEADTEALEMADNLGIQVKPSKDTEQSRRLSREVDHSITSKTRDISLFYGTLQNLLQAEDLTGIMMVADRGLKILLNIPRVFFFLSNDEKKLLTGRSNRLDKHRKLIESIAIPRSNTASILTKSLTQGKIFNTLDSAVSSKLAISDIQITRLLDTKGMVVVPMGPIKKPVGIMVLGVNRIHGKKINKSRELLELFAKQTAVCIQNIRYRNDYVAMIQDERMQAFSTITRRIIHEVNNPIVIVTNYLKMLSLKLPDKHPVQAELTVINEEIHRISNLINGLSGFSEPTISPFKPVDINQLFASVIEIIKKSILVPKQIQTTLTLDPEIPLIKSDGNGLKQVLINLLKNASEAMENGGNIDITTRFIHDSEKILIDEKKKLPGTIEIIISDNGPGIPATIRERLFEPYNSTKEGGGSGLGLSIVHRIIKMLNGTITCRTSKNSGTSFNILLPVASSKRKDGRAI